jgi:hypothetical protein
MPSLTQGQFVDLISQVDSTLVVQNAGGHATLITFSGALLWEGAGGGVALDVKAGSVRLTAVRGGLYYEFSTDPALVTQGVARASQPALASRKITTLDGRLLVGGRDYRGVFINAVDLFFDFLLAFSVTAVTKANPGVVTTSAAHGLAVNDPVYIAGIGGMTQLAGYYLVNTAPTGTTFTVKTMAGVPVNTTAFTTYTSGGTVQRAWFYTDLPTISSYGVKIIRVSLGHPNNAATWTSTIGTNGAAPNANLLTSLRIFLDTCWAYGVGVELCMFWGYATVPAVLSATVAQYQTPGSASRAYMTNLAGFLAKSLYKHPALAAYNVGNEWFDIASLAQFATVSTDTAVDHLKFLADICTEIVAAIRQWDNDRSVVAPHGTNGRFEGGQLQEFVRKWLYSAGACDIVAFHLYPDTDRSGFAHCFIGADIGGADVLIPVLRNAAYQAGKVLMVEECGADDDATAYSGREVGLLSRDSFNKCFSAGVELVADWSWYVTAAVGGTGPSDLKTQRLAVMSIIRNVNASLSAGFVAPPAPYPEPGAFLVPKVWGRGTGVVGSHVSIPNHPDISLATPSTSKMAWMFWFRKTAPFSTGARIFACDNGVNGWLATLQGNEGFKFYQLLNAAYVSHDLSSFTYPSNLEADPTKMYVNDAHHIAVCWDGTLNAALGADNKQHATIWVDGLVVGRIGYTALAATGATDRALFLFSNSDGSGSNAQCDLGDFMFGKGFTLTTQMVIDYIRNGIVPAGMQHRYKLDGNTFDSIGTLHGTAGPQLTYADSGIGSL